MSVLFYDDNDDNDDDDDDNYDNEEDDDDNDDGDNDDDDCAKKGGHGQTAVGHLSVLCYEGLRPLTNLIMSALHTQIDLAFGWDKNFKLRGMFARAELYFVLICPLFCLLYPLFFLFHASFVLMQNQTGSLLNFCPSWSSLSKSSSSSSYPSSSSPPS